MQKLDLGQIGTLVRKIVREEVSVEVKNSTHVLENQIRQSRMQIQDEINQLDNRMKNVEISVDNLDKDVDYLKKGMTDVQRRVKKIEKNVDTIARLYDETDVKLAKRVSRLENHLGLASDN